MNAKASGKIPAKYVTPLLMNGLKGRMLRLPAKKTGQREILLIYGHHASLERMYGVADYLNNFGTVTLPDLPGFGGMESFYKIGEKPTLDNFADYLASFVKLRFRNKKITVAGMSFGFAVVTRMLQKHPELVTKIDLVFSIVGMTHKDDIHFKRRNFYFFKTLSVLFSNKLGALFFRYVILQAFFIRFAYKLVENKHSKLADADEAEKRRRIDFEVKLWQANDVQTYAYTSKLIFNLNLCNQLVELPVYHVAVTKDRYVDNVKVEQHMRTIYKDFKLIPAIMKAHAPTILATAEEAAPLVPAEMRRLLRRKPSSKR